MEEWRDILEFEGIYQVSSFGRVKRKSKPIINKIGKTYCFREKVIRQTVNRGYLNVCISFNDTKYTKRVHRLLGAAFIPNPEKKPYINHYDGCRDNNFFTNLEWSTNSENQLHAYRVLGKKNPKSMLGKIGALCPNSKPIIQLDKNGQEIKVWSAASEADRALGIAQSCISHAANKGKTSLGFFWKYKTSAA